MGEPASFDERFDSLAALAYRVAFRLVGDRHVAENLAQEVLARAFAGWSKVSAYDEAWIVRVTTNLAISRWRRKRPEQRLAEQRAPAESDVAERLDIVHALRGLPRRQREVLSLRYLGDLTEAQTAAALGCSKGSVKQHAHRGLAAMRNLLSASESTEQGMTDLPESNHERERHVRTPR